MTKIQLLALARNKKVIVSAASAFSFLAGAAVGAAMAMKKLETKYSELADELVGKEIEDAKKYYSALHKKDDYETPEAAVEHLLVTEAVRSVQAYQGHPVFRPSIETYDEIRPDVLAALEKVMPVIEEPAVPVDTVIITNVFSKEDTVIPDDSDFDYEAELAARDPEKPYVISQEEFMEAAPGYEQTTVTYFKGDDVLSDDRDETIDEIDDAVGEDNLKRFGHGSHDNNIVYIRNEKLELDFEVIHSTGKYSKEILGFIEHSDRRPPRKFRSSDE